MIAVTHDCPLDLTPNIGGFKFVISLPAGYDITSGGNGSLVNYQFRGKYDVIFSTQQNE